MILAQSKAIAKKYAERAYPLISSSSPLGTTAAQIAASANYMDTLQIIEELMSDILSSVPKNQAIDYNKRNRFRELGYALILAGNDAKGHIKPLEEMLNRKVMSWAGWYGTLELSPKRMCDILNRIDSDNSVTPQHEFCVDDEYPYPK